MKQVAGSMSEVGGGESFVTPNREIVTCRVVRACVWAGCLYTAIRTGVYGTAAAAAAPPSPSRAFGSLPGGKKHGKIKHFVFSLTDLS